MRTLLQSSYRLLPAVEYTGNRNARTPTSSGYFAYIMVVMAVHSGCGMVRTCSIVILFISVALGLFGTAPMRFSDAPASGGVSRSALFVSKTFVHASTYRFTVKEWCFCVHQALSYQNHLFLLRAVLRLHCRR